MPDRLTLPPYDSIRQYEGHGNYAIDKYYRFPFRLFYRQKLRMIVEMLGNRTYQNILDFGSGPGIFTQELKKHAKSVISFDQQDTVDLRWKFDVIICSSVLEFVNLEQTLKLLRILLKPKGSIIVGSPMDTRISRAYFKAIGDTNRRHSHKEIIDALEKEFDLVAEKTWMGLYFVAKVWN